MCQPDGWVTNSVDPGQMLQNACTVSLCNDQYNQSQKTKQNKKKNRTQNFDTIATKISKPVTLTFGLQLLSCIHPEVILATYQQL